MVHSLEVVYKPVECFPNPGRRLPSARQKSVGAGGAVAESWDAGGEAQHSGQSGGHAPVPWIAGMGGLGEADEAQEGDDVGERSS